MVKKKEPLLLVINAETGETMGKAHPSDIVPGHKERNYYAFLTIKGEKIACEYTEGDYVIYLYPSRKVEY